MTKRIFRSIYIVALGVFVASAICIMGALYNYFTGVQQTQLQTQTNLVAQGVANEGAGYFENLKADSLRITWIDTDGTVLYDSQGDLSNMENHLEREEVKQALSEGMGESTRYSKTLLQRSLYCAKKMNDGTVLRLSVAQKTVFTLLLSMLQPLLIVFAIALVLSLILAYRLSKKIVEPLNSLDLDEPMNNKEYEELTPVLERLNAQKRQIKLQRDELKQKQKEFVAVTQGMAEGIILLNSECEILSINPSAQKILNTNPFCIGKFILSVYSSQELQELLLKSGKGEYCEKIIELSGEKYQLNASPIISHSNVSGTVLLLMNVTQKEKAQQLRREFTANVSHELKTPLHTISGCAELMANNMVKSEDVPEFAAKIYTQSQRMITLVEDIINLSHLDEGVENMKKEQVNLLEAANDVALSLSSAAKQTEVEISVTGDNAVISGYPAMLTQIIYNLCDNAIKYNRAGGRVDITVVDSGEAATLTVADTGIGIPKEHIDRIFESFYCVDKSRSKQIGGTGLGLSIVKHAAMLHNASITTESIVSQGTTITVTFPKKTE